MADTPEYLKEDNQAPEALQDTAQPQGIPGINININAHPSQIDSDAPPLKGKDDYSDVTGGKTGLQESLEGLVNKFPVLAGPNGQGALGGYLNQPQQPMPSTPGGEVASNDQGLAGATPPPGVAADQSPQPEATAQPQPMSSKAPVTPDDHAAQTKQQLTDESQNFQHDLDNGHIQPKTYADLFAKKDTLGKIGTIFGLMLSGAGSGLSHQPNMLMEMMNNEIKNDLEAQTKSATNKIDWYKASQQNILNLAQSKNLSADTALKAKTLANIQMNQAALHSLVQRTQSLPIGSPQRAQAEQVLAMVSQGVQSENFNLMDRAATASAYYSQMFGNGTGGGQAGNAPQDAQVVQRIQGLRAVNPKMAEDLEKRYVPGVGVSSIPIPDNARQEIVSKQKLLNTGNDLLDYSKNHSNLVPGTAEYRYGTAKAMAFQQEVREGLLGTVFRESEKPLLEKFVSENPAGAMKSFSTQPKLRAILDTTKIGLNTLKSSYGLPSGEHKQPPQQGSNPYEGKTASDKNGNKIVMKNGQWTPVSNMANK